MVGKGEQSKEHNECGIETEFEAQAAGEFCDEPGCRLEHRNNFRKNGMRGFRVPSKP